MAYDTRRRTDECLRCQRIRRIRGRSLCDSCYVQESLKGSLDNWPLAKRRTADWVDDFLIYDGRGLSLPQIADKLGFRTVHALRNGIAHARRRGLLPDKGRWKFTAAEWCGTPLWASERRLLAMYAADPQADPCKELGIKRNTLNVHKHRIRHKLGVLTFEEAVKAAAEPIPGGVR